jgi:hypothetical protein
MAPLIRDLDRRALPPRRSYRRVFTYSRQHPSIRFGSKVRPAARSSVRRHQMSIRTIRNGGVPALVYVVTPSTRRQGQIFSTARGVRLLWKLATSLSSPWSHYKIVGARLRIRLLLRMSGVEARVRIGMQSARWRNPSVQQWEKTIPSHLRALTATK